MIIGDSDDFRPLTALGGPPRHDPLPAPLKKAFEKVLLQLQFSSGVQLLGRTRKMRSSLSSQTHCWKRRVVLTRRGILPR
jgi:hypothetical protein